MTDRNCKDPDQIACFKLKQPDGLLRAWVRVSRKTGDVLSVALPGKNSTKPEILAEFKNFHSSGLAKKVTIHHLKSDDFVVISYLDLIANEPLDLTKFDLESFLNGQ
jgi:hypothetical protein